MRNCGCHFNNLLIECGVKNESRSTRSGVVKSFDISFNTLQVMSRVMKKEMEAVMSRVMEKEVEEMERRKKWECVSRNSIFMIL